ncbi:MAG TPA: DUF6286 domain-containing protein [Acidimicrobiia bacterium]|jgi:hypothetical protein
MMRVLLPVAARLISAILAIAMLCAGVVLVIEVVSAWVGHGWVILPADLHTRFAHWHWDDRSVVLTFVALGVVGLVSVLVGSWPRPPLTVPLDNSDIAIERHPLEVSLSRRLQALDGVTRARVRIDRGRVRATVDTNRRRSDDDVRVAAHELLVDAVTTNELQLDPKVEVHAPPRTS